MELIIILIVLFANGKTITGAIIVYILYRIIEYYRRPKHN